MARGDGKLIADVYAVLEANFADRALRIQSLAHAVGLSERQLQRRLREEAGKTPAAVLREYRLERAREYLLSGSCVGDVAHAVGFRSHAYFTHCFKAHFGMTPTGLKAGRETGARELSPERKNLSED